jgi:hypothetical protein
MTFTPTVEAILSQTIAWRTSWSTTAANPEPRPVPIKSLRTRYGSSRSCALSENLRCGPGDSRNWQERLSMSRERPGTNDGWLGWRSASRDIGQRLDRIKFCSAGCPTMTSGEVWDEKTAERYDTTSAEMFAPDVLDPAVDFLARRHPACCTCG